MVLLNIAGSVALILFGIRFLRKGLERMLGHQLHAWLERMVQRPVTAASAGFCFGTVAPSSTAQAMLTLQLLNAGRLSAQNMLVFLLGANVGITVTVQLIALRFFDYYSVLILLGFVGYQYFRSETMRGIGQSILGLGFIFLAMTLASAASATLTADPDFQTILGVLMNHRIMLVVFGAVLTLLTQSSTASIGLALAIGESGHVSLALTLPMVLGANLGIGLNSVFAGLSTWEGRRLAATNMLLKICAIVVALLAFSQLETFFASMPGSLARHTANFHTGFNVIVLLAGMILARPLGRVMQRTLKPALKPEDALRPVATHLDPAALASPAFALANATRETLRLVDLVKGMLEGSWRAYITGNAELAREIRKHDDRVDEMNTAIKLYLSQIPPEGLLPRDSQLQFGLLNFCSQLESIGDIIDKNICLAVAKHGTAPVALLPEDAAVLEQLYQKIMRRLESAISVLATRDRTLARKFLKEGDELKLWTIDIQKDHYRRLVATDPQAMESSRSFLDMVNVLRRISGQLSTIGHTFVLSVPKAEKEPPVPLPPPVA